MTKTVLNINIKEIDNKIPDLSGSVQKTDYVAKISEIEGKYFTTSHHNKVTSDILDAKSRKKL